MSKYYAYISGATNISVPVSPKDIYSGNSNHITLEFNGDNLRTDSVKNNAAVWIRTSGNWFSFEMYGQGWEYLNLGSTTYIGRYAYWSTNGFESTFVVDINNGSVTLTKGNQVSATTFSGGITAPGMSFFPTTYGANTKMYFYRLGIYGGNNKTLLYDFVPDYDGTTKGLRDKVSGNFYAATNQSKITLYQLKTFETDVTAITGTYEASSYTVNLSSDEAWTATTVPSWITLSSTAGTSGTTQITVSFPINSTYSQRTGTIVFTDAENETCEVECTQGKHPIIIPQQNIFRGGKRIS